MVWDVLIFTDSQCVLIESSKSKYQLEPPNYITRYRVNNGRNVETHKLILKKQLKHQKVVST